MLLAPKSPGVHLTLQSLRRIAQNLGGNWCLVGVARLFLESSLTPKGDLWVQSPMIIVCQSPNIRSIAENRRRSTEAYRRVMSTRPSMMVGTAEGDLPKLFSPALLA